MTDKPMSAERLEEVRTKCANKSRHPRRPSFRPGASTMTPIEVVARALYRRKYAHRAAVEDLVERHWMVRIPDAEAAIAALAEAIDHDMIEAGKNAFDNGDAGAEGDYSGQIRETVRAALLAALEPKP